MREIIYNGLNKTQRRKALRKEFFDYVRANYPGYELIDCDGKTEIAKAGETNMYEIVYFDGSYYYADSNSKRPDLVKISKELDAFVKTLVIKYHL